MARRRTFEKAAKAAAWAWTCGAALGCLGSEPGPSSAGGGSPGGVAGGGGAGATRTTTGATDAGATAATDADGARTTEDPTPTGLVVHEWGTFTSVQGSDGAALEGLHHEEEALPSFVYGRDIAAVARKAMETLPEGVTQKLETPVLYFYGASGRVDVDVRFPHGVVSQWFPDAASFMPAVGELQGIRDGAMHWAVDLDPTIDPAAFPPVRPDHLWAPSRDVPDAVPLRVGDEAERFIFYRGLGRFDLPLRVRAATDDALAVSNDGDDAVPAAFLLRVTTEGGAVDRLGALGAHATTDVVARGEVEPLERYVVTAETAIAEALEASGLTAAESSAMVRTWSRSWFAQAGTRVLYVVPRAWTDGLLPMTIAPAPTSLVRTLVGRIEVLSQAEEARLLSVVRDAHEEGVGLVPDELGRFAEPKLRRICPLVDDPGTRAYCEALVSEAELEL